MLPNPTLSPTLVLSQNLKPGQNLINIGIIDKVEPDPTFSMVRVTITNGKCISCAFYWFHFNIPLYIS